VPPGLIAWRGRDECGSERWQSFYSALEAIVAKANQAPGQMVTALGEIIQLLRPVLSDPWVAFSCGTGVAATLRLAAIACEDLQAPLLATKVRQELALFSSFDNQMKGEEFIDSSAWPIKWLESLEEILYATYTFKQWEMSIEPWRATSLSRALTQGLALAGGDQAAPVSPERIALITVCDYDAGVTPLASLSRVNKQAYADRHGYDFFIYEKAPTYEDPLTTLFTEPASHRPAAWSKVDAILLALAEGQYDWVMWMDCDSFFMDQSVRLEDVIRASEGTCPAAGQREAVKELVAEWNEGPPASHPHDQASLLQWYDDLSSRHLKASPNHQREGCTSADAFLDAAPVNETLGWNAWLWEERTLQLLASEDGLMLNTGNVLVRASAWSWRFFQKVRWMTFGRSPVTQHPWWEQTAMVYLLQVPVTLARLASLSTGRPSSEVQLERSHIPACRMLGQRHINSYPPLVASALRTHEAFEAGDFIVSFSGCKIYSSQEVCNQLFLNYFFQVHDVEQAKQHPALRLWL